MKLSDDHVPHSCEICIEIATRRGEEMYQERLRWGAGGRRCGVCGFLDGHTPDCQRNNRLTQPTAPPTDIHRSLPQ